jgi:hypothetical protein
MTAPPRSRKKEKPKMDTKRYRDAMRKHMKKKESDLD